MPTPTPADIRSRRTPALAPVIRSEWHKLRTTRSTLWAAGVAGALSIALSAWHCNSAISPSGHLPPDIDTVGASIFGLTIGQFIVAVAGVLAITGEYASGTIYLTIAATPQRLRLLTAKAIVAATASLAYGTIVVGASFTIGHLIFAAHASVPIANATTIRQLLGAAAIFVAMALTGLAIATITRRTAAALVATLAFLILPVMLIGPLPTTTHDQINRYLPLRAADDLITAHPDGLTLHPAAAATVITIQVLALLAIGATLLRQRDV